MIKNIDPEDKEFWSFYYSDEESLSNARRFILNWEKFLKSRKDEFLFSQKYHIHFKIFIRKSRLNPAHAQSYVTISKKFHINHYGDLGLSEWPEVKPVTIRDHIYLLLKKEDKPISLAAQIMPSLFTPRIVAGSNFTLSPWAAFRSP